MSKTSKILKGALAAISLLALGALVVVFLSSCGTTPQPAVATQTPIVVTVTPAAATFTPVVATFTPAAVDSSWERIQAAGRLIVGTSADYPPFESYVAPGQMDGFDIALMNEIGARLGLQTVYVDYAFDGLGPALLQEQVDVAIAAISRTPEREVHADFSNVYLVGEGAALAQQAADITLTKVEDIIKYKVGVQRAAVYRDQIQTTFIDTGQMSPDNLFAYEKAEDAIRDLLEGRLELVVMDAQPAQAFVEQGGVKVVGVAVNQQYYAIALPKGATVLKAKIDEVITALHNDGTIAALSDRYLGLPQVLPTPTPAPTSAPAPTPSCTDGLTLVKHLTKESPMQPGVAFTTGWQVQNTGTCPWSTGYRLAFVDGAKMGGEPVAVAREVKAGETYDVQLNLVSPLKAGDYQGIWQMADEQGRSLGERLTVAIRVLAVPTVTPRPTQTPLPRVQFTVDRTEIKAGECVQFRWAVQNVKAVYFYAEGERWQDQGVAGEGNSQECLQVTTRYYLRVVHRDNSVEAPELTIQVQAAPQAPQITRFTVDPAGQITLGQCVTIRWRVEGQVNKVRLSANGNVLWEPAPTGGNTQDCPAAAGTVAYLLEAVGPGGTGRGQQKINVVEEPVPTPPPPEDPVIYAFSVSPNQIQVGDCVNISWSVGGGTSYLRILRKQDVIVDNGGFEGQQQDCLPEPGNYVYRIEARNPADKVVADEEQVSVAEAPPQNPLAGSHWRVTALYDGAIPIVQDAPPTANFGLDGRLNGSAGCSNYSAGYLAEADVLTITGLVSAMLNCSDNPNLDALMAQDAAFLEALPMATNFTLDGQLLTIFGPTGQKLMDLSLLLL